MRKATNLLSHPLLLIAVLLVHCLVETLALFLLLPGPPAEENVVDEGIFQERQEHKDKAAHEIDVNGFDIGNFGQGFPKVRVDGRHGEDCGDPCGGRVQTHI